MIRLRIIECFKGTGTEPEFDSVVRQLRLDRAEVASRLRREPPLDDLAGLTLEKASHVMKQFAGQAIFNADIEKAILEFEQTRGRIQDFEKRAAGRDPEKGH